MNAVQRLLNESETSTTVRELCAEYRANNRITRDEYEYYDVKRGLRDRKGAGVLCGLTEVSEVNGSRVIDGVKTEIDGVPYLVGHTREYVKAAVPWEESRKGTMGTGVCSRLLTDEILLLSEM